MPLDVQGLTAYPLSAASARVRVGNFRPFLREHDVELTHRPSLLDAEYAVLRSAGNATRKALILARSAVRTAMAERADGLLLLQRLALLTPVPGIDPPRRIDAYDVDDALFVGSPGEVNRRFHWVKQEQRRATASMRRARLVIAGNPYLAEHARTLNRRVEIVPSCVDPTEQPIREHHEGGRVNVGWIGSHTTAEYLRPVLPVIARLSERGHDMHLVVVGGQTGFDADWIEHRPWSLDTQADDLADMDIGIMPLPDSAWARGKSGYKILQYFAAGVPTVATPIGINAQLIADGRGVAAESESDWEEALLMLSASAAERRQRGALGRAYVEDHYSYQRWAPELAALLTSLA